MSDESQWLVTAPEGTSFISALTMACKGNGPLANLLQYFLHEAGKDAKKKNIAKDKVEYIDINKKLDFILNGLTNYNRGASKKTIIGRIDKLQEFGYIQTEKYSQTYRIYFPEIQKAVDNPPTREAPKPRGRHAHKQEDCKLEKSVKSTTCQDTSTTLSILEVVDLSNNVENLQSNVVILQSKVENLQQKVENLQRLLCDERACREALEAKFETLYNDIQLNNINSNTIQSANAPVQTFEVPQQQKEKRTPKRTGTPPKQESLIDPKEIIFSEEEDRIYTYWCNLKAHNGFKQKKSTSMKEHFKRLAPVIASQEELQLLWDYARALEFNQGKAIYPGTLANAYPGWRSSLPTQKDAPTTTPTHTKKQPKPDHEIVFWTTDPTGVSSKHSNPLSWDYMTVAEAKAQDNGYKDGRLLIPIDEDNVKARKITLQQQQAKVAVNA